MPNERGFHVSKQASSYLKGATILAAAGILSRLLGLFYKVPLYQLVGDYGNGIYSNVTNIYNLLLMVSTVGFPVAISKMISENAALGDYRAAHRVFRVSMVVLMVLGGISSLILFLGAGVIIDLTGWPEESYSAIMGIAAAPFIISIVCVFRGFFQGFQIMTPTAVSQIIEQIVRVGLGIFLCWFFVAQGMGAGAGVGGAVFGATAGGVIALFFLWFLYGNFTSKHKKLLRRTRKGKAPLGKKAILKRLVIIAVPVTLSSAIVSLFSVIDSFIYVPRLAVAGVDVATATAMMGDYGNADTLINIPLVISSNLAVAMIPSISESFALKDRLATSRKIDVAIRLVILVALPCCIGLSVLSEGIINLLFPGSQYGAGILSVYAFATIFIMLSNTFQSILQSVDKFKIPLINLGIAVIIRFVTGWIFLAIPALNIYGIVLSATITFIYLTVSNFICVRHFTGYHLQVVQTVLKPLAASVVMGFVAWGVFTFCNIIIGGLIASTMVVNLIAVVIAVVIAIAFYGFFMILIGGIAEEEIAMLPGQRYIRPIYQKIRNFFYND